MRDVVMSAVRPLLLGQGKSARRVAWRLFAEYGVISTLLDFKRTLGTVFYPFSSFRCLPAPVSEEFIIMSLERLSDESGELTLILIPCNRFFDELVKRNRERLEIRFILRSPENACKMAPTKYRARI